MQHVELSFQNPSDQTGMWESLLADAKTESSASGIRDELGKAYQTFVPVRERLYRGQYFTPDAVCDLMLAWAIRTGTEHILDAGCGTGAFLLRASDVLQNWAGRNLEDVALQLHGIDIDPAAASIAAFQLQNLLPENLRPAILNGNFLDQQFFQAQTFDAVIGNPPYVRAEHLKQSGSKVDASSFQNQFQAYLKANPGQEKLFRSKDLYVSFLIRSTLLLKPGGRLVYITSNSWLNTEFGKLFAQFIHHHYRVHLLMESSVERWFTDAAVNPLIMALERKSDEAGMSEQPVRWIRFNQPLSEWIPTSDEPTYWHKLMEKMTFEDANGIDQKTLSQADLFQAETRQSLSFQFRASNHLEELLQQGSCWTPLDSLGRVRYPIKTGINRFFYLTWDRAKPLGIEAELLKPVIKSARHVTRYAIGKEDTDYVLFSCPYTLEELKAKNYTGALNYIAWGEQQTSAPRQKRQSPVRWPEVPSVQGREHWYHIPPLSPAHVLCNRFFDTRFFFPVCSDDLLEDQTFYGVTLWDNSPEAIKLMAALLNSTLSYAMVELHGRTSLGEGVLQYARKDMALLPVINPALFSEAEKQALVEVFNSMARRRILSIDQEIQQADRQHLDRLILKKLTNDPERLQTVIADELAARVAQRRALARSVKRSRK